jgi:hypothetical protein
VLAQQNAIAAALDEIERARRMLQRLAGKQVRNTEQRQYLKAVALSWFRSHRPEVAASSDAESMARVDLCYRTVLDASEKLASKNTYLDALKVLKAQLIDLRGSILAGSPPATATSDAAPDFGSLASDIAMREILLRRWSECTKCVAAGAYLAATVMMGGLLEALLVARANRMDDKAPLFKAKSTPLDPKTKKPLDLRQWTLAPYIDVAHDLGWITRSAKDVAVVLRDYRNYVHPEKERSHGIVLRAEDTQMFWELVKLLTRQLLASVPATPLPRGA